MKRTRYCGLVKLDMAYVGSFQYEASVVAPDRVDHVKVTVEGVVPEDFAFDRAASEMIEYLVAVEARHQAAGLIKVSYPWDEVLRLRDDDGKPVIERVRAPGKG